MEKNKTFIIVSTLIVSVCFVIIFFRGFRFMDIAKKKFFGRKDVYGMELLAESSSEEISDLGKIVAKVGTKVLHEGELDERLTAIFHAYPQLRGAIDLNQIPFGFKKSVIDKWIDESLAVIAMEDANIKETPDFQKAFKDTMKKVEQLLLVQEFEKRLLRNVEISEKEIEKEARSEYEKNKERFVKEKGGVLLLGASFEKREDANAFRQKASIKKEGFKKLAKVESAGKLKDFGRVDQESVYVSEKVRKSALNIKKIPSILLVSEADKTWVLHVSDKKETTYLAFNEVKDQMLTSIRNKTKAEEFQKLYGPEMKKWKKKYPPQVFLEEEKTSLAEKVQKEDRVAKSAKEKSTAKKNVSLPVGVAAV